MTGEAHAADARDRADRIVDRLGTTFAEEAGVVLADEPDRLWRLLVVTLLLSRRIRSETAVAAAVEVFAAGCTSPAGTRATTWNARVAALGRGGYRRYDFGTATRLDAAARLVRTRWGDDLRRLRSEADGDPLRVAKALQEVEGIGPTGARIFLREVQGVWPEFHPVADDLVLRGARVAGLPDDPAALAALVPPERFPHLCAALVRLARRPALLDER